MPKMAKFLLMAALARLATLPAIRAVILFFYRKMAKVAKPIRLDMLMATFEEPAVERPAATRGRERGGMSKEHRQHTLQSIYLRNRWCALDLAEHSPSKRELWANQDKERFFFRHRRYPGGAA
jgi:hypothetical protein